MSRFLIFAISGLLFIAFINCAVIEDIDVEEQGLYNSKTDNVVILTRDNFEKKIYGKNHAWMVQFYNTYCGHCRAFSPKFKAAAKDIILWKNVVRLAVLDCSEEENNDICREFEVMAYPSLRYFHANFRKGNRNLGDLLRAPDTADKFKEQLVKKLESEQALGRLDFAPSLGIASHATYSSAISDVPRDILYTFLVFENENSTIGSELALDLNEYRQIKVKRVFDTSELADVASVLRFPGLVAVGPNTEAMQLTPINPSKQNLLNSINAYLNSKRYTFPVPASNVPTKNTDNQYTNQSPTESLADIVFYSDLEKTIKTTLHTEITRRKVLSGEPLEALLNYLEVLISSFPFKKDNLKEYLVDLLATLRSKTEWSGSDVYNLVISLETAHAPVYFTNLEYASCSGSQPKYRGYTCGLWMLFHTLTVNAVNSPTLEGPKVLKAMHGYVKNFFGCTECAEHFQVMASKNKIFNVKDNDKAVLWLWISHNEVNLRLAGDVTEDPEHPKIQFPSIAKCPQCRQARGAWNLSAVFEYLQSVYGAGNIKDTRYARSAFTAPSFSNLDLGMLSLLYILSFVILLLVINLFLTKRYYRKHIYKHSRGKV